MLNGIILMKIQKLSLAVMLSLPCLVWAGSTEPVSFSPEFSTSDGFVMPDWDLTCDNAGVCRAVGYYRDEDFDWSSDKEQVVSVLLTRQTGVGTLAGFVHFGLNDDSDDAWQAFDETMDKRSPEMFVGGVSYGRVDKVDDGVAQLNSKQVAQIIAQANKSSSADVEFRLGKYLWKLSNFGLKEVLEEMDKTQGYEQTPLALLHKGNRVVPSVKYDYPVLNDKPFLSQKERQVARTSTEGKKLIKLLKPANLDDDYAECTVFLSDDEMDEYERERANFTVLQVGKDKRLITGECWQGAYNMGHAMWVVDNGYTKVYQAVGTSLNSVDDNQVAGYHKGRGIGDCWSQEEWTWDGSKFVQTYDGSTGQCRGFMGGAWELPTVMVGLASEGGKPSLSLTP